MRTMTFATKAAFKVKKTRKNKKEEGEDHGGVKAGTSAAGKKCQDDPGTYIWNHSTHRKSQER
jgi:hypothetical protein